MKHGSVSLVIIRAIHTAGANDAHRRTCFFHRADLHGAGVRAKHMRRAIIALGTVHIECVHFRPRRVVARNIQRIKIIPIGINTRTLGHTKTHVGENCGDLLGYLGNRMNCALSASAGWEGHIQPFALQTFI